MSEPAVAVEGLRKAFRRPGMLGFGAGTVTALDGVSFQLHPGEFVGLVGESGSGKTTLGRCLLALLSFEGGLVRVAGHDVARLRRRDRKAFRRRAQIVFQNPYASLNPAFRVRTLLNEAIQVHRGWSGGRVAEEVERLADLVRLPRGCLEEYPSRLSGGERRRVSFARALATRPEVMVADEPVSGLDLPIQVQLIELMRAVHVRRVLTFLLISHDLRVVQTLASRVLVLYRGLLVEDAPAAAFFDGKARHPYSRELLASALGPGTGTGLPARGINPFPEPRGCPFQHRCGHVDPDGACATMTPPLTQKTPDHRVACHRCDNF